MFLQGRDHFHWITVVDRIKTLVIFLDAQSQLNLEIISKFHQIPKTTRDEFPFFFQLNSNYKSENYLQAFSPPPNVN